MLRTFRIGGIHPPENKLSAGKKITALAAPKQVIIPLSQHIGAPAQAVVKKGDLVKVGTLVAKAGGFVSANIHSSVSGKVNKIDNALDSSGYKRPAIYIDVEGDEWEETIDRTPDLVKDITASPEEIVSIIRNAGIVGMGGAGYPTPIKVTLPAGKKIDCIILNGIECEPYLTADDRLMQEKAEQIIIGAKILNRALGIQKAVIAIDENKPAAIEVMHRLTRRYVGVNVVVCKTKYPQGAERQLIAAVTGREVPPGCLPIDVNCLVQNVGTVHAVYEAVQKRKPLFERIVTVSGDDLQSPGNYRVRIGTPASYLIEKAGPLETPGKIIFGGPMMGVAATNLSAPVTKTTSGILLLKEGSVFDPEQTACIRCGRCAEVCPQGLEPFAITGFVRRGEYQEAKKIHVLDCIECGSCSYICPARVPLTDYCKLAKYEIRKKK